MPGGAPRLPRRGQHVAQRVAELPPQAVPQEVAALLEPVLDGCRRGAENRCHPAHRFSLVVVEEDRLADPFRQAVDLAAEALVEVAALDRVGMALAGTIGEAIEILRGGGFPPRNLPQAPPRHVPDDGEEPRTVRSVRLELRQGAERANEGVLEHVRDRVAAYSRREGDRKRPVLVSRDELLDRALVP